MFPPYPNKPCPRAALAAAVGLTGLAAGVAVGYLFTKARCTAMANAALNGLLDEVKAYKATTAATINDLKAKLAEATDTSADDAVIAQIRDELKPDGPVEPPAPTGEAVTGDGAGTPLPPIADPAAVATA